MYAVLVILSVVATFVCAAGEAGVGNRLKPEGPEFDVVTAYLAGGGQMAGTSSRPIVIDDDAATPPKNDTPGSVAVLDSPVKIVLGDMYRLVCYSS